MDTNPGRPHGRLFWRAMGPGGHACHIYADGGELLETLTAYIGGGLWNGEATIVVATNGHLDKLDQMLRLSGLDLAHFRSDDRYISLSAESTLQRFMVEGWPEEQRFREVIGGVFQRAQRGGRTVRAFGEMVMLLWSQGQYEAAIRLERLWNNLLEQHQFRLLCGYPRADFRRADTASMEEVKAAHSMIAGA